MTVSRNPYRAKRPPWMDKILPGSVDEQTDPANPDNKPSTDLPPGMDMNAEYIKYLKELAATEADTAKQQLAAQMAATQMQAATERYKADIDRDIAKQGYLSQETVAKINGDVQGALGKMGIKSDFIQNMTGMKIKSSQDLLDSMLNNEQVKGQIGNDRLKTGLGLQAGLGTSILGNRTAERMNRQNTMANYRLGMADLDSRERLGMIDQGSNMFQNLQALRTQREGNLLGGVMNSANARSAGERGRQSDLLDKAIAAYSQIGNAPADGWIAQWNQARGQQVPDSAKTGTAANLSQLAGQIGKLGLGIDPNSVTDDYMSKLWDRGTDKYQQFIGGLDTANDIMGKGTFGLADERRYRRAGDRELMNQGLDGMNEDQGMLSKMMREIGNKTAGGNYLGGNAYDPSNMWDKYRYLNSKGAGNIDPNQEIPDDWESLAGSYDQPTDSSTSEPQFKMPKMPQMPNDMPNYPDPQNTNRYPVRTPWQRPPVRGRPNAYGYGGDETGYTDVINQQPDLTTGQELTQEGAQPGMSSRLAQLQDFWSKNPQSIAGPYDPAQNDPAQNQVVDKTGWVRDSSVWGGWRPPDSARSNTTQPVQSNTTGTEQPDSVQGDPYVAYLTQQKRMNQGSGSMGRRQMPPWMNRGQMMRGRMNRNMPNRFNPMYQRMKSNYAMQPDRQY